MNEAMVMELMLIMERLKLKLISADEAVEAFDEIKASIFPN